MISWIAVPRELIRNGVTITVLVSPCSLVIDINDYCSRAGGFSNGFAGILNVWGIDIDIANIDRDCGCSG